MMIDKRKVVCCDYVVFQFVVPYRVARKME